MVRTCRPSPPESIRAVQPSILGSSCARPAPLHNLMLLSLAGFCAAAGAPSNSSSVRVETTTCVAASTPNPLAVLLGYMEYIEALRRRRWRRVIIPTMRHALHRRIDEHQPSNSCRP